MAMIEVFVMLALLLASRVLVPKMMSSESAGMKYGIGVSLFVIYTAVSVLMFRFFCTFDGSRIQELTGNEVWTRVVCGFLLVNLAVLAASGLFYATRDRRKLSQKEKMKLKDL